MDRDVILDPYISSSQGPDFWDSFIHTADGRNPANQLRLVVYHIIYRALYIPGGSPDFFHQQYAIPFGTLEILFEVSNNNT